MAHQSNISIIINIEIFKIFLAARDDKDNFFQL